MRRINTLDELFAPGNPATSTKGTAVRNWWLNAIQEELAGLVEGLGGVLDPEDNGQLFALLQPMIFTNIVSAIKTDTWTASVAAVGVSADVPGLSVTITPTAIGKKILLSGAVVLGLELDANIYIILYRDGVAIGIGDAAGVRKRVTAGASVGPSAINTVTLPFTVLDSPATTDPVVYTVRLAHASSVTRVISLNRDHVYLDSAANHATLISSINAMEVNNA